MNLRNSDSILSDWSLNYLITIHGACQDNNRSKITLGLFYSKWGSFMSPADNDRGREESKIVHRDRCSRNFRIASKFYRLFLKNCDSDNEANLEIAFIYFHNYLWSKYLLFRAEHGLEVEGDMIAENRIGSLFLGEKIENIDNPYYPEVINIFEEEVSRREVDKIIKSYLDSERSYGEDTRNFNAFKAALNSFKSTFDTHTKKYEDFSWLHARCRNHLIHGDKNPEDRRNLVILESFCIVLDLYISKMMKKRQSIYMEYINSQKA